MGKNIVILLGSARRGGNTEILCSAFSQGAEESGHNVQLLRVAEMNIHGCLDCGRCYEDGTPCAVKDDMSPLYPVLAGADVIVLACPVYCHAMPAQLKAVIERQYCFGCAPSSQRPRPHQQILIATAGGESLQEFSGLVESYRQSAAYSGMKSLGELLAPGVWEKGDAAYRPDLIQKARDLGKNIV